MELQKNMQKANVSARSVHISHLSKRQNPTCTARLEPLRHHSAGATFLQAVVNLDNKTAHEIKFLKNREREEEESFNPPNR